MGSASVVAPPRPAALELDDIQGIIRRGYEELKTARFLLLRFSDRRQAGMWLSKVAGELRSSRKRPGADETVVNVAFTYAGLVKLGLDRHLIRDIGLANALEEGMAHPRRARVLGDHGRSAPQMWSWGGPEKPDVHAILMLYACSDRVEQWAGRHLEALEAHGIEALPVPDGVELLGRKEHFGFRDGIAQPLIAGLDDGKIPAHLADASARIFRAGGAQGNLVAAGEFILGYPNLYGHASHSPAVTPESDRDNHLTSHSEAGKDLGRNGSYMVFRQLRQDVQAFWQHLDDLAAGVAPSARAMERERLAAKMVGRWRDGCPVTKAPEQSNPMLQDDDDFGYFVNDRWGHGCPVGSHIRRTNPRDCMDPDGESKDEALMSVAGHRIVRRGRPYGAPVALSMEPADILAASATDANVGLHFICFNADIARQFEFIQQTWVINPKFGGLYAEQDPLLGDQHPDAVKRKLFGEFVSPEDPYRSRTEGLQRFVHVEGGGYFFMPGISAVKYLAAVAQQTS